MGAPLYCPRAVPRMEDLGEFDRSMKMLLALADTPQHGRHHAATGHLTRDEVFVPKTRKDRGLPDREEEGEAQGIK